MNLDESISAIMYHSEEKHRHELALRIAISRVKTAEGISPEAFRALIVIGQSKTLTPTEIAARTKLLLPSVSRSLNKLESRLFITSRQSDEDSRQKSVSITARGRNVLNAVKSKFEVLEF